MKRIKPPETAEQKAMRLDLEARIRAARSTYEAEISRARAVRDAVYLEAYEAGWSVPAIARQAGFARWTMDQILERAVERRREAAAAREAAQQEPLLRLAVA